MPRKAIIGINDLKTLYPDLINDWDYEKNRNLPEVYLPGSREKAFWKCRKCGNEWEAVIRSRNKGHGCPKCNHKKKK